MNFKAKSLPLTAPPTSSRTLIVGAGITGATVARLLHDAKRSLQYAGDVIVWEKNNIAGGRMMARSFKKNRHVHVDMGAQYLTNFSSANDDIRALLMREGKLTRFSEAQIAQDLTRPPPTNVDHTVANDTLGFRAVVEHFLVDSETQTSREVERIEVVDNGTRVKVVAADGHEEIVDDLVLTCPIPNLLSILENSAFKTQESQLEALQAVEYSQRIAVALLFDTSIAEEVGRLGWTSKYVAKDEDDIVRYLCWDNLKKQQGTDSFALLVHTGVPFGVQHMDDKDKNDEILATILASVKKLLPFLPEPEDSLLHRWRMSQVTKPYRQAGAGESTPSITLSQSPRIIVAGDAFLGSVFDNCLLSAKHAAAAILESRGPTSGL